MAVPEQEDFAHVKVLASDEDIHNHYVEEEGLGAGMFGETVQVRDVRDPAKQFAMKIQSRVNRYCASNQYSESESLRLYKELLILNRILPKHPNIIQIIDILVSPKSVFIVQELCLGKTLDEFLFRADNDSGRRAFSQLLEAVHTCHEYGVVHRDIKEDNIMFLDRARMQLKLIDFGCAVFAPDMALKRHQDFDYKKWWNPEDIERDETVKRQDVQCLGTMLHGIMCGKHVGFVFSNNTMIMETTYRPRTERFDPAALDLLKKIGPEPFGPENEDEIWTTDQIRQHPWITGVPNILFQPLTNLNEVFGRLKNDLTVIKLILKDWILAPINILAKDQIVPTDYQILGRFYRGDDQTRVLIVTDKEHKKRVMKVTYARMGERLEFVNEDETKLPIMIYMELLIRLRILPPHDNIAIMKCVYLHSDFVLVVTEFLENNSLEDFFPIANDLNSREIFKQIADTVSLLHRHGVVHMDLHPHHIVFARKDFSSCKIVNFSRALYAPQISELSREIFRPENFLTGELVQMHSHANVQEDITALGRILHAMMVQTWEPDPTHCGDLWPNLGLFGSQAMDLLSKIGPEPFGPAQRDRNITMYEICYDPWLIGPIEPRRS